MTLITFQDGKVVMRDGQVGTEQACCCGGCSGPCETYGDCPDADCDCVNGQCVGRCVETPNEIWNDCTDCPNLDNCTTQCIPAGTGPPNIPPCGVWVKVADAASDCIPCGDFNPFP